VQFVKVKVAYLSILRDVTKKKEEELEIQEGATVMDLIELLMKIYGDNLKPFLEPDSEMGQGIILTLNGELIASQDLKKRIPENAELLVGLPPFGG
jgi:MoaD family protein